MSSDYIAIHQQQFLARGTLEAVVHQVKSISADLEPIVIEADSCKRIELNWYGDAESVLSRLTTNTPAKTSKRGRPKLGVISKEVTLLPRHWEWLGKQPGGASVTLRKLVEQAQKQVSIEEQIAIKQQQLDELMMVIVGDIEGYEDASRALYRNSKVSFEKAISAWPGDIKQFVLIKFNHIAEMHSGAD